MQPETLGERAAAQPVPERSGGIAALLRHLFSFPAFLIVGLVIVTVYTTSNRFNDPDLWWQLRVGQIIATTHSIPATELFSFTAQGHLWTAHEWLAQLSMYITYAAGGPRALMLWLCAFASLTFALVYALCWMQTGDGVASFVGGLIAWFFATVGLAIRALILGHLFLALEILLLEMGRTKNHRWLWCLPPIFTLWANCHASYIFGLAVLGVYWISSRVDGQWGLIASHESWEKQGRRLLSLMLLLCPAALCCNPVGMNLLRYPFDALFRLFRHAPSVNAVEEWLPPTLNNSRALGMLCIVVAILLFSLVRRSELYLRELLLVFMALGLALQYVRMLFVFGIVVSPIFCRVAWSSRKRAMKRDHPIINAIFIFGGLAAIASAFPTAGALQDQVRRTSPVAAVDYIRRQGLSGPMLNEYVFGGYLIWALPEHKVFIDGRADVYDWAGVFPEYGRWATLEEDPALLLDKYHIRFCLLSKTSPLSMVIPYLPGWRKVYSDDVAEVFAR